MIKNKYFYFIILSLTLFLSLTFNFSINKISAQAGDDTPIYEPFPSEETDSDLDATTEQAPPILRLNPGEPCTANENCIDGVICKDETCCQEIKDEDIACEKDSECCDGVCEDSKCRVKGNGPCKSATSKECASGLKCTERGGDNFKCLPVKEGKKILKNEVVATTIPPTTTTTATTTSTTTTTTTAATASSSCRTAGQSCTSGCCPGLNCVNGLCCFSDGASCSSSNCCGKNLSPPSLCLERTPGNYFCCKNVSPSQPPVSCSVSTGCCGSNTTCEGGSCCLDAGSPCINTTPHANCCSGSSCISGSCQACGTNGLPCCPTGNACGPWLKCSTAGICIPCGNSSQPCCPNSPTCNPGLNLICAGGNCQGCGGANQICCPSGSPCGAGYVCNSGNICQLCGQDNQACCTTGTPCSTSGTCISGICKTLIPLGGICTGASGPSTLCTSGYCQATAPPCNSPPCSGTCSVTPLPDLSNCAIQGVGCDPNKPCCNPPLYCAPVSNVCKTPCGQANQPCCATSPQCSTSLGCIVNICKPCSSTPGTSCSGTGASPCCSPLTCGTSNKCCKPFGEPCSGSNASQCCSGICNSSTSKCN